MKRTAVSIVALLFLLSKSYAQQWQEDAIIPIAPDAWSMIKYGGQSSPDLYTGTLHVSIPLYTYKDPDFEFPVTLNYTTSGYQPNRTTGPAGLGWTLNAGGVITREINGIPDEASRYGLLGHLYRNVNYYDADPFGETWDVDQNWNYYYKSGAVRYEEEPDVFSFSFLGHSGKFILIRKNNSIIPLFYDTAHPAGEYSVEINDLQSMASITIIAGDGMRYTFESCLGELFQSYVIFDEWSGHNLPGDPSRDIVQWYLTEILAPNGRSLSIRYASPSYTTCVQPYAGWGYNYDSLDYTSPNEMSSEMNTLTLANTIKGFRLCTTSYVIPERIQVNDVGFDIQVYSSNRIQNEKRYRSSLNDLEDVACCKKLDSLIVRNTLSNDTLKIIRFAYKDQFSSGNPILLLKSLYLSGEGVYGMDYYSEDAFPYQGTTSIDHWGYLNATLPRYVLSELIPQVQVLPNTLEQSINTQTSKREPNAAASIKGCLSRLSYPTGGYTSYEYEGNTFSAVMKRTHANAYQPALTETSYDNPGGGVRIKKITDSSLSSPDYKREYKYTAEGDSSSGILMRDPMYYCFLEGYKSGILQTHFYLMTMTSWSGFSYPVDSYDICYSRVCEESTNGAITSYSFSSVRDMACQDLYPDNYRYNDDNHDAVDLDLLKVHMEPYSRHAFRGKMVKKTCYSENSPNPWLMEEYEYENKTTNDYPYISGAGHADQVVYEKRIYLDNVLPKSLKRTIYEGSDSLVVVDSYAYNGLNQLMETCSRDYGLGTATLSRTQYLNDVNTAEDPIYAVMQQKNILNFPIRTLKAFSRNTATPSESQYRLTEGRFYKYGLNGSQICLDSLKTAKIHGLSYTGFSFDNDLVTEETYTYNTLNRPIEIRNRSGRPTSFIWGYRGLYPVARLENASRQAIGSLLGVDLKSLALPGKLTGQQEALLYESSSFETSIYEWKPFVGVLRICTPARLSTYYSYDTNGRLCQVADNRGRPITEYKYHIISE